MKNIIFTLTMLISFFLVKAQCIDGNCNNGLGTYENYESIYRGDWKDGMKDGKGIYTEKKANREYGGDWVKGKKHGEGAEIDYLGVCYIGHWENDVRKGEGVLLYKNGYYKKGIFPDNLKYYTNENVEISENEFTKVTDLEILNRTGYGCVSGDCKNGTGTYNFYHYGNKCTYTGQWKNGRKNGEGTLTQDNGYSYTGHWKNDMQDGQGTEIGNWFTNDTYEGNWERGHSKGKGTLTSPNGYYLKGTFDFWPKSHIRYYTNENIEISKEEFEKKTGPAIKCYEGNCYKGLGVCKYPFADVTEIKYHLGYWNDRKKEGFGIDYTKTGIKQYGVWENDILVKILTQNEAQKYLDADPMISDQIMYVYFDIASTESREKMDELNHKMRMEEIARKQAKRDARNAEWASFNRTLQIMNSASNTTTTSNSSSKSNTSSTSNSSSGNGTGTTKMPDIIYKTVGGSGTTIYTHKQ
ncbi:MAG: hypothetical protein KAY50_02230 [Chitinophagaceae bacterium]|nr:hypothetical protein [Chitinophagaceae bacterium]